MPAIVDKVVVGWAEVDKALGNVPPKLKRNALRRGLYAAAAAIRDSAKRKVPVRLGFLRRQMAARSGSPRPNGDMVAYVSIAKGRFVVAGKTKRGREKFKKTIQSIASIRGRFVNPRRYAHLVEFGTKHAAKRPYLEPAAKETTGRALDLIAAKIREDLKL